MGVNMMICFVQNITFFVCQILQILGAGYMLGVKVLFSLLSIFSFYLSLMAKLWLRFRISKVYENTCEQDIYFYVADT